MPTTISHTISHGITLGVTYTSPLTITTSGYVHNTGSGDAILGPATQAWTVANSGRVVAAGTSGDGIDLKDGGLVTNSGTIRGQANGVYIGGAAGTVTNSGTIDGTASSGVTFAAGGTVSNKAGTIEGGYYGVYIEGAAGSVTNSGTILGASTAGLGIHLHAGGTVVNNTGGLIEGASGVFIENGGSVSNAGVILGTLTFLPGHNYGAAIYIKGGGGVTNSGTIRQFTDTANFGIELHIAGSVVNQTGGLIDAITGVKIGSTTGNYGTVTNAGTILGTLGVLADGICFGVYFLYGGAIDNTAGLIEGASGIYIKGGAGTVTNAALIEGTAGFGTLDLPGAGIEIKTTAGTVTNTGTILATAGTANYGVEFYAGGSVGNNAGLIEGVIAVKISGGGGTVTNAGTITGTSGASLGVYLLASGAVSNNAGLIKGASGVYIKGGAGTVTNAGSIVGTVNFGVDLAVGGSVGNNAGLIQGIREGVYIEGGAGTVTNSGRILSTTTFGIQFAAGGTVIDLGTISGGAGTAISFGGTGGNLLVLENGYSLTGGVSVAGTANTLELLGTAGAVTVDFDKSGAGFTNFGTAAFGAAGGNIETLNITNTSGTVSATISDFTAFHDIVDLTGLAGGTIVGGGTVNDRDQLVVSNGIDTVTLQLDTGESYSGVTWLTNPDGSDGTDVTPACFARGTLILTPDGEVLVEELAIGDLVVTPSGEARPIRWIGQRAYDGRFIAGNRAVLPIRIEAGALADGMPARDLFVSPEHALVIDGLFLPARLLVNGSTIHQVDAIDRLEYFHIEADGHDVIFAEGAAAETFVDVGGRAIFHNGAEFATRYPDAAPAEWEPYAALLAEGVAALPAIRASLLTRAETLGRVGRDPDLHLLVDGEILRASAVTDRVHRFAVPAGTRNVIVASRSVVPRDTEAELLDPRRLGVPFVRAVLERAGLRFEIGPDCAGLCDGFHADEGSHRWTDGHGRLPPQVLACFAADFSLELLIGHRTPLSARHLRRGR